MPNECHPRSNAFGLDRTLLRVWINTIIINQAERIWVNKIYYGYNATDTHTHQINIVLLVFAANMHYALYGINVYVRVKTSCWLIVIGKLNLTNTTNIAICSVICPFSNDTLNAVYLHLNDTVCVSIKWHLTLSTNCRSVF